VEKIRRWTENEAGPRPKDLKSEINRLADNYLGPVRGASGIIHALAELEKIEDQLGRQTLRERRDLLEALEVESLCLVAQLIGKAAMARTESRGVHFRDDYPAEDNLEWRKHIVLQKKGESVEIGYRQADQPTGGGLAK
jgi:succinate dehydrogenase/fumarate reductase flavoprotein subunit